MAMDRSIVFRGTLFLCVSCVFLSLLFYISFQPSYPSQDSYGTKMPIPATLPNDREITSSGLYTKSEYIDELNTYTFKMVKEGKAPTMLLYYASWCGHCRYSWHMLNSIHYPLEDKSATYNNYGIGSS